MCECVGGGGVTRCESCACCLHLQGVSNGVCQYIAEYLQFTPDWEIPAELHKLCSSGAAAKQVPVQRAAAVTQQKGIHVARLQQPTTQLAVVRQEEEDEDADLEEVEEAMQEDEDEQEVVVRAQEAAKRVAARGRAARGGRKSRPAFSDE